MIQILSAHCKSSSFSQLPGNILSNQLKHSFVQQSPQAQKGQGLCHMPPDHSTRQQQGIQGSSLITKEQKLPATEWEKQVNRTKRAICYTCASQKNAFTVLSELSALLCLLVQLNQSIPQVSCYRTEQENQIRQHNFQRRITSVVKKEHKSSAGFSIQHQCTLYSPNTKLHTKDKELIKPQKGAIPK